MYSDAIALFQNDQIMGIAQRQWQMMNQSKIFFQKLGSPECCLFQPVLGAATKEFTT